VTINGDNTPPENPREKKSKDLKSNQKQLQNLNRNQPRLVCWSTRRSTNPSIVVDWALTATCADVQNNILDSWPGDWQPPFGLCCSLLVGRPGDRHWPTPSSLFFCALLCMAGRPSVDQASVINNASSFFKSWACHWTPNSRLSSPMS